MLSPDQGVEYRSSFWITPVMICTRSNQNSDNRFQIFAVNAVPKMCHEYHEYCGSMAIVVVPVNSNIDQVKGDIVTELYKFLEWILSWNICVSIERRLGPSFPGIDLRLNCRRKRDTTNALHIMAVVSVPGGIRGPNTSQ